MNPAVSRGGAMESLGLTDFYHVGIAVRNIDDAIHRFHDSLGVGRWATMLFEAESTYLGEPQHYQAKIAFAPSGLGYVELVEPVAGRSPVSEFLAARGEGVYHLGYWADDLADTIRRADDLGLGVVSVTAGDQGPNVAYLDIDATFGVHIELVSATLRPLFEAWVAGVQ